MSATRIVTDLNGRVVTASPDVAAMLAIEERWLMGKPLAAFVAPDQVREFRTLVLELAQGGGPIGTTLTLQRRGGQRVPVEVEAVLDGRGDRLDWLLTTGEGTNGERLRGRVPTLKALPLRRLLTCVPIGVVSLDQELTVEYVNPAGRVFLDGARIGKMLPEALPSFSVRGFARRLFGEVPPERRVVVETHTGRLLELDGIPGGPSETALLLVQDVTSRERRRRAEHDFAANAAHELRTPIAAITSALDVLQAGAKEVPSDRDRFLGHIEQETTRLGRLVAALMLLARIQTGQEQPALRLVDAAALLEDVAAELEPRDGVNVRVDCGCVSMLADVDLLRQAIWNLAQNAVRHTVSGEILLAARDLGRMAEIEVRDTGLGIAETDRPLIFNRFYRSKRPADGGFGLGLPLSQEIARALGGTLSLDSEPGVGTRVRMRLPSARLVS